jgi:acyl carrier protein
LEKRVRALVADMTGTRIERISLNTRISHDIGCDGDDAVELFEAFAKEFDVDLSGIKWERHFGPEGGNPFGCFFIVLVVLFGWSARGNKIVSKWIPGDAGEPVTIGDLVAAARAKRWVKTYSTLSDLKLK